jgi:hypothetical protein
VRLPVQVAFHNIPPSREVAAAIRTEAAQLEGFYDHLMSCRVVVDVPHRHHKGGNFYQVRVDLKVPGREIAVSREPAEMKNQVRFIQYGIEVVRAKLRGERLPLPLVATADTS